MSSRALSTVLPKFVVQRVGKGKDAHARVSINGHRLEGVTGIKVEKMAAGLYTLQLTVLAGMVHVLPDVDT